ncbi:glutamate racemase [Francisella frigiditurris]|uniref:Glutamate racemase n=1 Tax=Francisella frigiditurris TaxID=1542390 RepID=A0A1J0KTJ2_9GAMM|nr:glutamate racemase [Francisella frigiditurris]APC96956.1 glutamate racemase [Francisella frigiditurris]
MDNRPIGVFDSGVGGLSVMKSLMKNLPNEKFVFFGDTARAPYGIRSSETIKKFSTQIVNFLLEQSVKALVIACNTITAAAEETIKNIAKDIPVINVIRPTVNEVCRNYKSLGLIATEFTVSSNVYPKIINLFNEDIVIYSQACSLLVPRIELGVLEGIELEEIVDNCLRLLKNKNIEALILGCTHYSLIKNIISRYLGKDILIIDPAEFTALEVKKYLENKIIISSGKGSKESYFFVSGDLSKFKQIGEMFLESKIDNLERVSLDF